MNTARLRPRGARSDATEAPLWGRVVPEGYILTSRFLRYAYVEEFACCGSEPHAHPEHLVFWPTRGSAEVAVDGVWHSLTVGQGLWVPAGTAHWASRAPSTTLAALHLLQSAATAIPLAGAVDAVHAVVVTAALRELLVHLDRTEMPKAQRLRAQRVCLELITEEEAPVIELPLPRDSRIAPIARAIVKRPADDSSISDWAWRLSLSSRTIARAFAAETGMTFSQWRSAARMSAALRLLCDGVPVGEVSRRVGYTTVSAFSAAFHRKVGRPPHRFLPRPNGE